MAYNTAKHDSTGFSPAYLNFGRELTVPDTVFNSVNNSEENDQVDKEDVSVEEVVTAPQVLRLDKLKETFELVRLNLNRAFNKQSHHYNLRRRDWRCKIGDQVMKVEHHLSDASKGFAAKLAPKYSGPYKVIKVLSPVVYNIKSNDGKIIRRVHVKDLKEAKPSET